MRQFKKKIRTDLAYSGVEVKVKEHGDGVGERSVDNHEAALAEEQNPIGKRHEILKKIKYSI